MPAQPLPPPSSDPEPETQAAAPPPGQAAAPPHPESHPDPPPAAPQAAAVAKQEPATSSPAAPRRAQRSRTRLGRPPNINENSLMRRLECVMAVDSGRMTMLSACQQYDISARTFYRWLRNKDRLIELTGFSEDDFKDGPPNLDKQAYDHHDSHRMPPQRVEVEANLPRLPTQPVVSGAPETRPAKDVPTAQPTPTQAYAGSKRRLPKSAEQAREYGQQSERPVVPNPTYYRRNFTKMPSQAQLAREPPAPPSDRHAAARSATRMRRDAWQPAPEPEQAFQNDGNAYPATYVETRSDSPADSSKRRKTVRSEQTPITGDGQDQLMVSPAHDQLSDARGPDEAPYANGGANHQPQAPAQGPAVRDEAAHDDAILHGKSSLPNGVGRARNALPQEPFYDARAPRKHRIEIMMGRRKVTIAWYDGAASADIKASIARRFALLPGTQWALMDKANDEIVISDSVPSGRYTLTVFT